jgi:hypothetical protein
MKATIETQVCTKCRLEKPLSEFYFKKDKQKHRRDCKECAKKKQAVYREANREKVRACDKAWRDANPEKNRAKLKAWREANPEKCQGYVLAWQKANPEKYRDLRRNWERANREKCRARCAKRRADRIKATPAWADLKKIEEIYKDCPPGHHIDHIFPLNSPIMCGLHVESNLQYLPAKENISKGNRVSLQQQLNG